MDGHREEEDARKVWPVNVRNANYIRYRPLCWSLAACGQHGSQFTHFNSKASLNGSSIASKFQPNLQNWRFQFWRIASDRFVVTV